jgi:hypothetical protein
MRNMPNNRLEKLREQVDDIQSTLDILNTTEELYGQSEFKTTEIRRLTDLLLITLSRISLLEDDISSHP